LQKNGAYFGIPLGIDTLSLFINEDIFKSAGREPPGTWDDFIATARALTVKDQAGNIKTAGAALGTFDNVDHASDILSLLFIQNGADLLDLGGAGKKNAVDALDFYVSFAKDEGAVWSANMPKSKLAFAKGELAMYFGYSWDLYDIRALNPNLNFKIVPVPRLPGRSMTIASYWAEGVSSKTKHPKEAFEFLKFLAKKENISRLYENETKILGYGRPYARKDMAGLLSVSPLYPFVAGAENAFSTPFSSDTYDGGFNSVLNAYLNNAVNSVLNGSVSTDTAIDTLAKGVSGVISRYEKKQQANTGVD
jgi:multiple sugar transport system substrate-binding protein